MNVNADKTRNSPMKNCELCVLGSFIDEHQEIKNRLRKASKDLRHLITSRKTSHRRRIKIYETYIRPVLMYSAETWTKSTTEKAAVFERKCLKKCTRLLYRPGERNWRNEELYEKAKLKTLEEMQEQGQWAYLGHVLRRQEGNPHRELMKTFEKTKKRRRGRPRSNLFEEVREKIRRWLKVEELVLAAGSRQEWRRRTVQVRRSERSTRRSPPADEF